MRFFFILRPEEIIQIFQNRHILWPGIIQIILIDQSDTTVDYGFLNRLQAILATDHQLTKREYKIRLQGQRAFFVGVVQVQVHWVDEIL